MTQLSVQCLCVTNDTVEFVSGYKELQGKTSVRFVSSSLAVTVTTAKQSQCCDLLVLLVFFFFFSPCLFRSVRAGQGAEKHGHSTVKCCRSGKPIKLLGLFESLHNILTNRGLDIVYCMSQWKHLQRLLWVLSAACIEVKRCFMSRLQHAGSTQRPGAF